KDLEDAIHFGMQITHSDAIAACWQVKMTKSNSDAVKTLNECRATWDDSKIDVRQKICEMVVDQYFRDHQNQTDVSLFETVCSQPNLASFNIVTEQQIEEVESRSKTPLE